MWREQNRPILLSFFLAKGCRFHLTSKCNRCNSGNMPRGRQSRALSKNQIERLERFRRAAHEGAAHGYSLPQLRMAIGASFGWRTLAKALQGRPVWDLHHSYIVQWIDRYLPPPVRDGKAEAAGKDSEPLETADAEGETKEQNEKAAGAARTLRGSR